MPLKTWKFSHLLAATLLAALSFHAAVAATAGPSFSCSSATRAVDKLICASPALSRADMDLADAYRERNALLPDERDRRALRDQQRAWLAERDRDCPVAAHPPAGTVACLERVYASRIAELKKGPSAAPQSPATMMDDAALAAALPKQRDALDFPSAIFSADGRYFAFAVSQITSGDTDQVWLYRMSDAKLVPASPAPLPGKVEFTIFSYFFNGDTLYLQGNKMPAGDAQSNFSQAVTMTGARDVANLPAPQLVPGAARDTTAAAGDDFAYQGDKRLEDDRYQVTSRNLGHGALTLTVRPKKGGHAWTIANGSWNLDSFLLDAPRERLVFDNGNGGIEIYDLVARKVIATIPAPIRTLLDVTNDGRLLAFTGVGGCRGPEPTVDAGHRAEICFVSLPG